MKDSAVSAELWLSQAENDLAFAKVALREEFFAQACFNSHQVAEKALKALAYLRGDRYVLGHSLDELLSALEPSYAQLSPWRDAAGVLHLLRPHQIPQCPPREHAVSSLQEGPGHGSGGVGRRVRRRGPRHREEVGKREYPQAIVSQEGVAV